MLVADGILSEPLLYLSLYFKQHRSSYYDLLQRVRFEGEWEEWLTFFFTAVLETAQQAASTAHEVLRLFKRDRSRVDGLGRTRGTTILVHNLFQRKPYLTISSASKELHLSQPAITNAMQALQELKMVKETSGRNWNRIYVYSSYLRIMTEGTEAPGER
jgi:Fic family protein